MGLEHRGCLVAARVIRLRGPSGIAKEPLCPRASNLWNPGVVEGVKRG